MLNLTSTAANYHRYLLQPAASVADALPDILCRRSISFASSSIQVVQMQSQNNLTKNKNIPPSSLTKKKMNRVWEFGLRIGTSKRRPDIIHHTSNEPLDFERQVIR